MFPLALSTTNIIPEVETPGPLRPWSMGQVATAWGPPNINRLTHDSPARPHPQLAMTSCADFHGACLATQPQKWLLYRLQLKQRKFRLDLQPPWRVSARTGPASRKATGMIQATAGMRMLNCYTKNGSYLNTTSGKL